jgi:hypothetical protein
VALVGDAAHMFSSFLVPVRVDRREVLPLIGDKILREDRLNRTRGLACAAVDADFRIDIQHRVLGKTRFVFARMDAVDRANIDAGGVLRPDARFSNHVSHGRGILGEEVSGQVKKYRDGEADRIDGIEHAAMALNSTLHP